MTSTVSVYPGLVAITGSVGFLGNFLEFSEEIVSYILKLNDFLFVCLFVRNW